MTSLQDQLFTRLNLKKRNDVTFEELPTILFSFADTIPFENLDVIARNTNQISGKLTRENFN